MVQARNGGEGHGESSYRRAVRPFVKDFAGNVTTLELYFVGNGEPF